MDVNGQVGISTKLLPQMPVLAYLVLLWKGLQLMELMLLNQCIKKPMH